MKIGASLGACFSAISPHYRNLVRRNLSVAYARSRSPDEIERLTRLHFRALGRNLAASLRMSLMDGNEVRERVSYEGIEALENAIASGHGVIAALNHTCNWELYSRISPLDREVVLGTIYQAIRNPFINRHIEKRRSALGTALFERGVGFAAPSRFLRNQGILGVLMDQYPGRQGIPVPLFGRLVSSTSLPALLSLRTGAPIVFVSMAPDGEASWKITFHAPVHPPADREERHTWIGKVTAGLNEKLTSSLEPHPQEWFWVHDRFKSSGNDVFPRRLGGGSPAPPGDDFSDLTPHYFLVRSPNPLGDACMSIPAVRAIKRGRPDAHVTILCRSNLEPLWREQPEVDDVIALPGRVRPSHAGELIKGRRPYYDTGILFPNSTRSALEMKLGGVHMIYGYEGHHRRRMLRWTIPEPPADPPTHHLERYLFVVGKLGADVSDRENLLALPRPPAPIEPAQSRWKVALCPGAEFGEAKRWPTERFVEAVRLLREQLTDDEIEIVIVGSPAEQELGESIAEAIAHPRENLAGKTTIGELIEHLQTCHIVVSNDTGTMHLAAALGIPTVAIFGSTSPELTSPIGSIHRVIREKVECSPCFKRTCPIDFRCMTRIPAGRVVKEIRALMAHSG